jgi:hypothetical protein
MTHKAFGLPGKGAFCRFKGMQDFQLYQQIPGLVAPWRVKQVTLDHKSREVLIEVECTETMWGCPTCSERMHVHDWERRRWRHLDSCQYKTINQIKFLCLKTARAWGIKEMFRGFLCCLTVEEARTCFKEWYHHAIHSRLEPVKKVARMCKNHLRNILTYFEHRMTNGPIEGLNNKIQGLIKKAYGYRNRQRFIADIYFHLGGLNLYPANESCMCLMKE